MVNHNNYRRYILSLLWTLYINGNCDIVKGPVDTEILVGDSTYLNCSISALSQEISWYHYPIGKETASDLRYVYVDGKMYKPYNRRYRIIKDLITNSFNLIITNAEAQDAGRYVCQNGGGTGQIVSAELVVLTSIPSCVSNIDPIGFIGPNSCGIPEETIQLSCEISFTGNVSPKITWYVDRNDKELFPITQLCNASDTRVTSNYSLNASIALNGSSFRCQTTRSTNVQYSCKTDPVMITPVVANKTRIPKTIGDEVTCSGNFISSDCEHTWLWYDFEHQEIASEGGILKVDREGLHRCEATCRYKQFECKYATMWIKASADDATSAYISKLSIAAGVAVAVVLLFLISILFVLFARKRKIAYIETKMAEIELEKESLKQKTNKLEAKEAEYEFRKTQFESAFAEMKQVKANIMDTEQGIGLYMKKVNTPTKATAPFECRYTELRNSPSPSVRTLVKS